LDNIYEDGESWTIFRTKEQTEEINSLIKEGIFQGKSIIPANEVMAYVNRFFELEFINNCDPTSDFWRMSINTTTEDLINKLKEFNA